MSTLNTNQSSDLNAIETFITRKETNENSDDEYEERKSIFVHKPKFKLLFLFLAIFCLLAIIFALALTLIILKKAQLENVQQQMPNDILQSYNLETNNEEYLVIQQIEEFLNCKYF